MRRGSNSNVLHRQLKKFLCSLDWPGNVRQVKNAMERLALFKPTAASMGRIWPLFMKCRRASWTCATPCDAGQGPFFAS
jgi:DNA-binding NtrC family response regulator